MSFLSIFNQAEQVSKPWECNSCRKRFLLKAHAANHQRQSNSSQCRTRGFCRVELAVITDEEEEETKSLNKTELNEEMAASSNVENAAERVDREQAAVDIPFGPDDEEPVIQVKKDRMSRRGMVKSTPYKISKVLRRMEELADSDSKLSNRAIAATVGVEFSTHWRNCYRWRYE